MEILPQATAGSNVPRNPWCRFFGLCCSILFVVLLIQQGVSAQTVASSVRGTVTD